ncbi:MAG TPA: hypothetical protein VE615_12510 [Gaiellaceae bacterium]|jgi:hypothetical protein|nr:hypothetical protein [Gaiellaceae bacterium]
MRRWALLAIVAVVAAGCGGEEDLAASGPGAAAVRKYENLYAGHFERAWNELHPAHQRIVSRARFARCARAAIAVGDLESIEVLDVFDDDIRIAGIPERRAKAVRVRVSSFQGESFTAEDHEVKVGDDWRWVLNTPAVEAYRQGRCPR